MKDRTMDHRSATFKYGLRFAMLSLTLGCVAPAGAIVRSWDDSGGSANKNWSTFGNWNPDGSVQSPDDIFIGNLAAAANDTTIYDVAAAISSLTLSNGADVDTNGNEFIVNGLTTVGGVGSSIILDQNTSGIGFDSFDTDELIINSGGSVQLTNARLEVDGQTGGDDLEINAGGTLSGYGFVDLQQSVAVAVQVFENSGTLTASNNGGLFGSNAGTLTLNVTDADGIIDLDGDNEVGVVNINRNDTLSILGGNLANDPFAGTMNLGSGAEFTTNNIWSLANGDLNVNTSGFFIGTAGAIAEISGSQLTMNAGSTITLDTADIDRLQFNADFVATGGTIANSNEILFNNTTTINAAADFQMLGSAASITLLDGATVTINDANFNLDGTGFSTNVTTIGNGAMLDINHNDVFADDSYGHTINLNGGELDVTNAADAVPWTINPVGVVTAGGAANSTLDGDELNVLGNINVEADSTLNVLTSGVTFDSGADITVAAGGHFNVNATSRWESSNVTVTGAGILGAGTAIIGVDSGDTADVVWSTDTVNVDDGPITVNPGSSLTINTDSIDNAGDGIDTTITIADTATLTIGLNDGSDVIFEGTTLNYNGNIISSTFLPAPASGSAYSFNNGSTVNINGDGTSDARLKFSGTAVVNINDALEDFRLNGGTLAIGNTNEIDGGTVNGPGELQIASGRALRGNGTINAQVDGDGSAQLIAEGGQLNVNGVLEDIGTIGTSGNPAVLNITQPWNTNVTATVLLQGGLIQGAAITNDGVAGINGNGTVIARVFNNTRIGAEGGSTLIIQNTLTDWDGSGNTGTLNALGADLELRDNIGFLFRGTVQANTGREVFANGFELEFEPASTLNLNGGTYRSTAATDIGGTVNVPGGVGTLQINGTTTFESTSNTTLGGDLVLDNPVTRIQSGATFSGGGTLENPSGSTLTLLDGADVDVLVENSGTLVLGASAGQTTGLDFQQTAAGTWDVELGGTGLNDFDRMTLTGIASLAGILDVSLIGGFIPTLGDNFTVLLAGSVIGTFDSVLGSPGAGLVYDVTYNPGNVTLTVATSSLVGDLDGDGFVGINDLNIVLANWNQNVPPANPLADPSGDGFVGIDDLNQVLGNWNAGTPPTAAALPEPTSLGLLVVGSLALLRRRQAP